VSEEVKSEPKKVIQIDWIKIVVAALIQVVTITYFFANLAADVHYLTVSVDGLGKDVKEITAFKGEVSLRLAVIEARMTSLESRIDQGQARQEKRDAALSTPLAHGVPR
jgi:hypothetical protein